MKICFITPFFHPVKGGMEEHVLQLAKGLIKKGHDVSVFTSNSSRVGKILGYDEIYQGIKIRRFNTWFKLDTFSPVFPFVLYELIHSDFDIVHVHSYRHVHNLAVLFTKSRCFMTLHWPDYPKGLRSKFMDFIIPFFDKTVGKFLLHRYDKLIAVNGLEVSWIKNNFNISENKIKLIPNAIPKDYLKLRDGSSIRKKFNIKKNKLVVLSFSRMHKSKGLDLTVNIAKFFPNVKFIIAGADAGELINLKSLASKLNLDNIIFMNDVDEKIKLNLFSSSDIFLFPSHYDAFGIVLLEAFSQKLAVIASDSGGIPWVVDDAGLIFKDNDLDDLKNKLSLLINDPKLRSKYSKLGYSRVKNFTWENIVDSLDSEYKSKL